MLQIFFQVKVTFILQNTIAKREAFLSTAQRRKPFSQPTSGQKLTTTTSSSFCCSEVKLKIIFKIDFSTQQLLYFDLNIITIVLPLLTTRDATVYPSRANPAPACGLTHPQRCMGQIHFANKLRASAFGLRLISIYFPHTSKCQPRLAYLPCLWGQSNWPSTLALD